ncbi:hypothetical protein AX289_16825 [Methylorubrum populi]|nr:hypothetical protein AX289_16825 [Methylorubrum populi]
MSHEIDESKLRTNALFLGQSCSFTVDFGLLSKPRRRPNEEIGERVLGAFILPPFQRPAVWTQEQQIRFVESIWYGLPLPAYIYNLTRHPSTGSHTDYWLIDGQQRWTAVLDYVEDKFPVLGYLYSEVSHGDRYAFESRPWTCVRTEYVDELVLRDIYDRLAYGGTPHDPSERPAAAERPTMR